MKHTDKEILQDIQDIIPTMIACVDKLNHTIVYTNKQLRKKLDYSKEELLGLDIFSLIIYDELILFADTIANIDTQNKGEALEVNLVTKQGLQINAVLHSAKHDNNPDIIYLLFTDNTKQNKKNKALDVYKQIFSSTRELVSLVGKDMNYIKVNKAYSDQYGLKHDELVNKSVRSLHGDKADLLIENLQYTIDTGEERRFEATVNNPMAKSGFQYMDALYSPYYDDKGNVVGVIVSARDITPFKLEEIELEKKMHYYRTLFRYSPDLLASVDLKTGIIIECNRTLEKTLGYKEKELNGKHVFEFNLEKHNAKLANAISTLKQGVRINDLEVSLVSITGEVVDTHLLTTPLIDIGNNVAIFVWRDVRHQKKLAYKATHDLLTKLLNRSGFLEELIKPFGRVAVKTLSYIDVDNFKTLNDTYGHHKGDEFLMSLAEILNEGLRTDDCICRIGGDEFVILINDVNLHKTKEIMQNLLDKVSTLIQQTSDYRKSKLGISIGIAEMDSKYSMHEGLEQADNACCEAKRKGKNRIVLSTATDQFEIASPATNSKVINLKFGG